MIPRNTLLAASIAAVVLPVIAAEPPVAPTGAPATQETKGEDQLINELFVGEKIYMQDKGEFVLVLTPTFSKTRQGSETELSAEMKYGVTDRLQVSAEFPYVVSDLRDGGDNDGIGDMSVAFNYNFLQMEKFSLGVRSELLLPTGDRKRGLGGGELVWLPSLLGAARIGKGEVYAGIGAEVGEHHDAFTYTLAGAYPWERFAGVMELTGVAGDNERTLYVAPGAYWHATDKIDVGLGMPIGLTHDSDNYRVIVKLIFEF